MRTNPDPERRIRHAHADRRHPPDPPAPPTAARHRGARPRAGPPRARPRPAAPDARGHRPARRRQGHRRLDERAARARAGPPGRLAAGRPAHHLVLRPDRHPHRARRGDLPHRAPARQRRRGDPVVVDWRAPISTAFYRASPPSRWGSTCAGASASTAAGSRPTRTSTYPRRRDRHSGILAAEIERPRSGPMRDIVSTIQPEQDEIVRSDIAHQHLRAGGARHRQDGGRPAPRRLAALLLPRPARPVRCARGRPQPRLPRPHRRRAALPRRGPRRPRHHRHPARARPGAAPRTPPTSPCSRATRGWPRCCTVRSGRTSAAPRRLSWCPAARAAGACRVRDPGRARRAASRAGCATPPPASCSPSGWRTTCCCRWSAPATPPTTGCRTPSPVRRR